MRGSGKVEEGLDMSVKPPEVAPLAGSEVSKSGAPAFVEMGPVTGHLPPLDGLRGIAILLVLLCHFTQHIQGAFVGPALHAARHGVDLFFVLSGFLITGILIDGRGAVNGIRNFFARRALRIFPLYFSTLVMALVVLPWFVPATALGIDGILDHQLGLWLYCSNLVMAWSADWVYEGRWLHFSHFWSLAIEEQFYLLWPFAVFFLSLRALAILSASLIVVAALERSILAASGVSPMAIFLLTPCRIDALAFGVLLAVAWRSPFGRRVLAQVVVRPLRVAVVLLGLVCLVVAVRQTCLMQGVKYFLIDAACAWGVALALQPSSWPARLFASDWLRFFGKYSYGIYVFHALLVPVYLAVFGPETLQYYLGDWGSTVAYVAFATLASVVLAVASWHGFERRFLGMKRWFPTCGGTGGRAATP